MALEQEPGDEASEEESAPIVEFVAERDEFRLVIRGHALIEKVLDEALRAEFGGRLPRELRSLRLGARVALAEALELITDDIGAAITTLAGIRNEFAHGAADEVTEEHYNAMAAAVEPFLPDDFDPSDYSWGDLIRVAIAVLWDVTIETTSYGLEQRQAAREALKAFRAGRTIAPAEIERLLAEDSDD